MSNIASAIKAAEAALEKGDYNFCIKIVDPLLLDSQADTSMGGKLRLIIVTAYMGKGEEQKAISICQTLIHNKKKVSVNKLNSFYQYLMLHLYRDLQTGR